MPVIGAVIYLDEQHEKAIRFLEKNPKITLGQQLKNRLPIVLESDSRCEEKTLWAELQAQDGVSFCSVVFADFSDVNLEETA